MIVVTGNGDLPLATQRRVERRSSLLIDRPSPSLDRIYQLGLWLAIFFAIFLRLPPNKFLRIPPDLSQVSIGLALLFLLLLGNERARGVGFAHAVSPGSLQFRFRDYLETAIVIHSVRWRERCDRRSTRRRQDQVICFARGWIRLLI